MIVECVAGDRVCVANDRECVAGYWECVANDRNYKSIFYAVSMDPFSIRNK